jgi:hypothetical protein
MAAAEPAPQERSLEVPQHLLRGSKTTSLYAARKAKARNFALPSADARTQAAFTSRRGRRNVDVGKYATLLRRRWALVGTADAGETAHSTPRPAGNTGGGSSSRPRSSRHTGEALWGGLLPVMIM